MKIIETNWKWNGSLGKRRGAPPLLVHHNSGGLGPASGIHAYHRSLGWSGIAYHYYIRKDGTICRGRPEWAMGGHTHLHGSSLGICSEGNYQHTRHMPQKQKDAVRELTRDIHSRYPRIKDIRHKDVPDNSTDCPGKYYPFAYVVSGPAVVTRRQYPALKKAMVKYAKAAKPPVNIPTVLLSAFPVWGSSAETLAWRVSSRINKTNKKVGISTQPTPELYAALLPKD